MILLVIDTQKLITNNQLYAFDQFVSSMRRLIKSARENNIEIIYVRHIDEELIKGTEGFEIYVEFKPVGQERIFDKTVNSPFKESGLLEYLRSQDINDIIVTGLQTEYCIDATVKCAFEHGIHVIVPAYANTTCDNAFMTGEQSYHYYNEFMWKNRYAECISLDEMIKKMDKKVK